MNLFNFVFLTSSFLIYSSVNAASVSENQQEFKQFIDDLEEKIAHKTVNVTDRITNAVSSFEFKFFAIHGLMEAETRKIGTSDKINIGMFDNLILGRLAVLNGEFSKENLQNSTNPFVNSTQHQYLDPVKTMESNLVIVATFRENSLECLSDFQSDLYKIINSTWSILSNDIDSTVETFETSLTTLYAVIESDVNHYIKEAHDKCGNTIECLEDYVSS